MYFVILFVVLVNSLSLLSLLDRGLVEYLLRSSNHLDIFLNKSSLFCRYGRSDFCYVIWRYPCALWISLWGKMPPPINSWYREHRFAILAPIPSMQLTCNPCVPMTALGPVLSAPIMALKTSIRIVMSFLSSLLYQGLSAIAGRKKFILISIIDGGV